MENLKFDDYNMDDVSSSLEDYLDRNIGKVTVWGTGEKPKTITCTRQLAYSPIKTPWGEKKGIGLIEVFVLNDDHICIGIEILEIGLVESITHVK